MYLASAITHLDSKALIFRSHVVTNFAHIPTKSDKTDHCSVAYLANMVRFEKFSCHILKIKMCCADVVSLKSSIIACWSQRASSMAEAGGRLWVPGRVFSHRGGWGRLFTSHATVWDLNRRIFVSV
jgi:hypothetical protein